VRLDQPPLIITVKTAEHAFQAAKIALADREKAAQFGVRASALGDGDAELANSCA